MTEAEAKERWCPFSRSATTEDASINRCGTDSSQFDANILIAYTRCIASECMVWRWTIGPNRNAKETGVSDWGCCGLAGKP